MRQWVRAEGASSPTISCSVAQGMMASVVSMTMILMTMIMMLLMIQTLYCSCLQPLSVHVFSSWPLLGLAAIVGGRTGCAESGGLCDLPFSHTAIPTLQTQKRSGEFIVISVTASVSLCMGPSPLALSRPLVQSWTGDNTTPSHHCLQKEKKQEKFRLQCSIAAIDQYNVMFMCYLNSVLQSLTWTWILLRCFFVLFLSRLWCWVLSPSVCLTADMVPRVQVLFLGELMACE